VANRAEQEPPVDRLARRTGEWFSFLFLACMAIIAWEVFARYGLNAPTIWAHDLTIALCAVGFLVSGVYTLRRGAHIRISLVYDKLPGRVRRVLDVVNGLIMLAFLALLLWQGAQDAWKSVAMMETAGTASRIPIPAIAKSALVLACALMLILGAAQTWRVLRGRPPIPDEPAEPER